MVHWRERLWLAAFYPLEVLKARSYTLTILLFVLLVLCGGSLFHFANAQDSDVVTKKIVTVDYSEDFRKALYDHPTLRQAGARSCRAMFTLEQRRADNRVSVSAELSGERELAEGFDEGSSSSASRGYNADRNDLFDIDIQVRYRLFDWGVNTARIRSEKYRLLAERLSYESGLSSLVQDILRLMMQVESGKNDVQYRKAALEAIQPHLAAIEAQGRAGTIGLAKVREVKLLLLDAEVSLQQVERSLAETINQLESTYLIGYQDAYPLLQAFLNHRQDEFVQIPAEQWREVRVLDNRINAEIASRDAISNEGLPNIDTIIETTLFDTTNFGSEYQVVGRLVMNMPLYDGGARRAREQEKSWQLRELRSQREEQIRNHQRNIAQSQLVINQRRAEIVNLDEQLVGLTERLSSLVALVDNSRVSRQEIIQLILSRAEKQITRDTLFWQQEFAQVQINWLADNLLHTTGVNAGGYKC